MLDVLYLAFDAAGMPISLYLAIIRSDVLSSLYDDSDGIGKQVSVYLAASDDNLLNAMYLVWSIVLSRMQ